MYVSGIVYSLIQFQVQSSSRVDRKELQNTLFSQFNSQCILVYKVLTIFTSQTIPRDFDVKNKVTEILEKSTLADKRPKDMDGDEFLR